MCATPTRSKCASTTSASPDTTAPPHALFTTPGPGDPRVQRTTEILASHLLTRPRPTSLDLGDGSLPSLPCGGRYVMGIASTSAKLDVIRTPREAPDHICLLDRREGILFCGDILLEGPVWTHLDGGSLPGLVESYRRLMESFNEIRHHMPSDNAPWLERWLLPETLQGVEAVPTETANARTRCARRDLGAADQRPARGRASRCRAEENRGPRAQLVAPTARHPSCGLRVPAYRATIRRKP